MVWLTVNQSSFFFLQSESCVFDSSFLLLHVNELFGKALNPMLPSDVYVIAWM